jgi:hypothetical protein
MSIHQGHLQYSEFIKNELYTLNVLSGFTFMAQNFSDLYSNALEFHSTYYTLSKKNQINNKPFSFGTHFDLNIEKAIRRFTIECQVLPNFSMATYVLGIFIDNCEDQPHVIRKFHFDYAIPIKGQEAKPVYHIQYGGKATPKIQYGEKENEVLNPWLSNPRISYTPMSLALLLDSVFYELKEHNESANGIIERDEWRQLIKRNEEKILKPYYKKVTDFLNGGKYKPEFLLRDFCYGGE